MKPKIAVYLDQVHNDPIRACELISGIGISDVVVRRVWSSFLNRANNDVHIKLQQALSTFNLNVPMIECDSGTQIAQLADELKAVDDLCKICQAYKCQQFIVHWGRKTRIINTNAITAWVDAVSTKTLEWAVQPLYQPSLDGAVSDPAIISSILQKFKRWKLIYDPASLIAGNTNHITRYWSLLHPKIWGVNINDALPGSGRCPLGSGNAKLDILVTEWARSNFRYWLILKPGFKYNTMIWPQFVGYMQEFKTMLKKVGILNQVEINWGNIENARHD